MLAASITISMTQPVVQPAVKCIRTLKHQSDVNPSICCQLFLSDIYSNKGSADAGQCANQHFSLKTYAQGEVTSHSLWSRNIRHFVGITWHNVWS